MWKKAMRNRAVWSLAQRLSPLAVELHSSSGLWPSSWLRRRHGCAQPSQQPFSCHSLTIAIAALTVNPLCSCGVTDPTGLIRTSTCSSEALQGFATAGWDAVYKESEMGSEEMKLTKETVWSRQNAAQLPSKHKHLVQQMSERKPSLWKINIMF